MNITQTFYDNMASQYDKLFLDWQVAVKEQAVILDKLFKNAMKRHQHQNNLLRLSMENL